METREVLMRTTMDGDLLYEIKDIAAAAGVTYQAIYCRIYQYRTLPEPTVQVGRRYFYTPEDYDRIVTFIGSTKEGT